MILAFKLSMPSNNSWNGKWTGQDKFYVKVRSFQGKRRIERAEKILNRETPLGGHPERRGYYSYGFGDGWRAGVDVHIIDKSEAARLRRQSDGFCGYDWMVDSIIENLEIKCSTTCNT